MVQPCCYCGIPLQRATQYVGIADVILGLLNFIVMVIHVKELFESDGTISLSEDSSYSSYHYRARYRVRTFPGLAFIPRELALTIVICHGVQFIMGIGLYLSAVNKNRNWCLFWLGVTAVTALFTGLFIRLYEMLIVNEFAHELKLEQEVTYFPGQNPNQLQPPQYPQYPQQPINQQPTMVNPMAPSADPHANFVTIPTITPAPYNPQYMGGPPEMQAGPHGYYNTQYSGTPDPMHQYHHVPAALQPPPHYDLAVSGGMMGNSSGNNGGGASGYTVESVLFPNEKNEYRNSFSKF